MIFHFNSPYVSPFLIYDDKDFNLSQINFTKLQNFIEE